MFITLIPAYGRDYKSKKEVLKDWDSNKDFIIQTFGPNDGRYINKSDASKTTDKYTIRYNQLRSIVVVNTKG